jgi:NAD(P)-dependent dehydrogenase (short-subunit alcohol dehydrogenase family)
MRAIDDVASSIVRDGSTAIGVARQPAKSNVAHAAAKAGVIAVTRHIASEADRAESASTAWRRRLS